MLLLVLQASLLRNNKQKNTKIGKTNRNNVNEGCECVENSPCEGPSGSVICLGNTCSRVDDTNAQIFTSHIHNPSKRGGNDVSCCGIRGGGITSEDLQYNPPVDDTDGNSKKENVADDMVYGTDLSQANKDLIFDGLKNIYKNKVSLIF